MTRLLLRPAKPRAEGITEGDIKSMAKLVADGLIPLNVAVSRLNFSEEDVLKAIQLLGFNYKEAIEEPLTRLCANAI